MDSVEGVESVAVLQNAFSAIIDTDDFVRDMAEFIVA